MYPEFWGMKVLFMVCKGRSPCFESYFPILDIEPLSAVDS
jgi:hypothetical protein